MEPRLAERPARRRATASTAARAEQLAARVRWLDRYRRRLAVAGAALIGPLLFAPLADELGADWPRVHELVLWAMLGVGVWWLIELGLVYLTALWETEHAHLVRTRGLPAARVIRG